MQTLQKCIDSIFKLTRITINAVTGLLDKIISHLGPNGYFLYGVLSNTIFFAGTMVIRFNPQIDWSVCLIARGVTTFLFSQILASIYKMDTTFPKEELKYVTLRNSLIGIQQFFFYFVVTAIPVKFVWVINNVGPIFVFILSYVFLKIKLTCKEFCFLMLSLLGIQIITAPQIVMKIFTPFLPFLEESSLFEQEMDSTQLFISFVYFMSIWLWAGGIVVMKLSKTATSISINSSLGLHFIIMGSIGYLSRVETIRSPTAYDLLFVFICVGVPTFISQMLFIHGQIVASDQGKFSLTNYIPVFHSYLYQLIFEDRSPKLLELFGVFFTFYGVYKVVVKPKKKKSSIPIENIEEELEINERETIIDQRNNLLGEHDQVENEVQHEKDIQKSEQKN